ncbi:collagen alpha-2(I) chain [Elephas maximus indicus]|uniref:collagen alpha-2(I) chain n=1 Tax=Elephas maximus indicus TaxID=99487 RepID=UPI002116118C|nr:collagen alpha-2(I) chain [Elephas maximus indicus]
MDQDPELCHKEEDPVLAVSGGWRWQGRRGGGVLGEKENREAAGWGGGASWSGPFKRAGRPGRTPPSWGGAGARGLQEPGLAGARGAAPAGAGAGRGARRRGREAGPEGPGPVGAEGSTIWRGGSARPLGGKRVRWAGQEERGGLGAPLPEQQPQRVGVLSWGPQQLRGLKLGVEEQGGVGPAVQEEGGVGLGVQERGGRGHEPSLGVVWGPPARADWRRPPPWTGSAGQPVAQEEGLGPGKQHQEKGGGSPAVQERGEARAGVQERGEGSPRRLLQRLEQLPELGDGSWERGEELESSGEQGERYWDSSQYLNREAVVLGAAPARRERLELDPLLPPPPAHRQSRVCREGGSLGREETVQSLTARQDLPPPPDGAVCANCSDGVSP